MLLFFSLFTISTLHYQAVAAPGAAELNQRAIATGVCSSDNLLRSFIDPRTSLSASSFCSSYIRPTVSTAATKTATVTATVTAGAAKRELGAPKEKRDLGATTYPASRLSSACSCILTVKPTPTTVFTSTVTRTVTTKTTIACKNPTAIVQNGGFESGLTPWAVSYVFPEYPAYAQYMSFNISSPGYNSANAYTVTDKAAGGYFQLDLTQTITLCKGQTYNFAAQFYMTDSHLTPQQTHLGVYVDQEQIARTTDGKGPPIVWAPLTGSFVAGGNSVRLRAAFSAIDYLTVTWGIDDVVITPA